MPPSHLTCETHAIVYADVCGHCEDDKLREWKTDGHKLVARFHPKHGYLTIAIECPQHEGRACKPDSATTVTIVDDCHVAHELGEVGGDLFESCGEKGSTVALPAELRWRWHIEHGEDAECYIEVEFVEEARDAA